MKVLILALVMIAPKVSHALVSCGPSSCTSSCSSGCYYYSCSAVASFSKTINQIPVNIVDESGGLACSFSPDTIDRLPFTVSGPSPVTINQLPVTFSKSYYRCQSHWQGALSCPPP